MKFKIKKIAILVTIIMIFFTAHNIIKQNIIPEVIPNNRNIASSHYPVYIKTYNTNQQEVFIKIKKQPQRVIAYHQDNIELLLKLGLGDKIIATAGRFISLENEEIQPQQDFFKSIHYYGLCGINQEFAVSLQPDLIMGYPSSFSSKGIWSLGTTNFWNMRGCNCYIAHQRGSNNIETLETEYKFIRDVGNIFNREKEAELIVVNMEDEINNVLSKVPNRKSYRVMVIYFTGKRRLNLGVNTLVGNIVERLGSKMVDVGQTISFEDIVAANPDVLFVVYNSNSDNDKKSMVNNRLLASVSAVKNKKVYLITQIYTGNSGVRTLEAIKFISKRLYPELLNK